MSFKMAEGTKFACMALKEVVSLADGLSKPLDLGDGLWALFAPPFEIPKHWRDWLGSIQAQHFSNSNLLLLATSPSGQESESDRELAQKVWSLFYAILMHGIPQYEAGLLFTGEKRPGAVDVQSVTTLFPYYRPAKVRPARIDEETLKSAADAAAGLRTVYANQQNHRRNYRRLGRGFEAWVKGVREEVGIYRLHQFVRAVEATVKPSPEQARQQFIDRCQLFVGCADQARTLLGELYDLRRCVEHMNDWREVLDQRLSASDQDTIGAKLTYQAELLASYVYRHILKEDNLLDNFIDDTRIDQFWARPSWRATIDLEAEAGERFRDFLDADWT